MVLRFADEVRMVGHLEHPNIVPIHDVGKTEEGQYYFVMKYLDGETLESVIEKLVDGDRDYHRRYTFEHRTLIFLEILKAMEFAHHRGIIHRDLKPANIMIGSYGEVMVMDWGIARNFHQGQDEEPARTSEPPPDAGPIKGGVERLYETQHATVVGPPLYMSPEQVRGLTGLLDERSDIYNLCAVFYEFLALKPYISPKPTMKETLLAVLTEKPTHPMLVWTKNQPPPPADLGHFVLKGLAKDPAGRFQSVREMRERLERIGEGYFPVQCPWTLAKRSIHGTLHFVDHHPVLTLLSLMTFVGGLVAGGYFLAGAVT